MDLNFNVYLAAAVLIASAAYGVWTAAREMKGSWARLSRRYRAALDAVESTNGADSVFGTMKVDKEAFPGRVSVHECGVVFRKDKFNGYELLCFPWTDLESGSIVTTENDRAVIVLLQPTGAPIQFDLAWSPDLTKQARKFSESIGDV